MVAAHTDDTRRSRTGRTDIEDLVAALANPVAALLTTMGQATVGVVEKLIDQAFAQGRAAGLTEAEHRVVRQVGVRTAQDGMVGTLVRCTQCGVGVAFEPDPGCGGPVDPPRRDHPGPDRGADTAILPRIRSDDTEVLSTDQIRRAGPGR